MITNYCSCTANKPPYHTQFKQIDLLCNSVNLTTSQKKEFEKYGVVFDDSKKNISHLNYTFSELTAHYWVWKNSKEKFVTVTHYRRFWNEKAIKNIDDNTIVVIDKQPITRNMSLYEQFSAVHGSYGLEIIEDILNTEKVRYKKEHFEQMKTLKFMHPCNMYIASKTNFDIISEVLFEILFKLYARTFEHISNLDKYQSRFIGFVSERILTTIFVNINDYIKDAKIEFAQFQMYE